MSVILRVLFVNHTGLRGGAENTLLRLMTAVDRETEVAVACPPKSPLAEAVAELGAKTFPIRGTSFNLRLEPRQTAVGSAELVASAVALGQALRAFSPA